MEELGKQEGWSMLDDLLRNLGDWAVNAGLKLLAAGAILLIGWWATRLICKALKKIFDKGKVDPGAGGFILSILRAILLAVAVLAALGQLVNISSMVAALGAAGLTASFALQGSLGNFVSGMQVIFSKPFSVGDFLSVDGNMGTVREINVLNTVLVTIDNKEIIIPNSRMTSDIVVNYTAQKTRRLDLSYSVAYSTDLTKAKRLLWELLDKDARALKEPPPVVAVGSHGPSAIELVAKVWVSGDQYWDLYYDMQERVKAAFDENQVEIPFPQMDIHTK